MRPHPKTRAELEVLVRKGTRPKYVFFWGHTPTARGALGKECLSQWYPAPFELEGHRFSSAEHAMMWGKARLFGDGDAERAIASAKSPAEAKQIGRSVRGFDESRWKAHRFAIVRDASVAKFGAHASLRDYLLGTGDRVLVEASPVDRIWGIGLEAKDERAENPLRWQGENLLGFALMDARAILRGD